MDRVDEAMTAWPLDGPYDPERTVDAARTIAELVRYLNHATAPWKTGDCLQFPSHLGSVVANLRGALYGLEQLGGQLAHHARRFGERPGLYDDRGGDPAETVATVEAALGLFAGDIVDRSDLLGRAHEAANHLGIREEGDPR
jgi:hypothetical protein